MLKKKSQASLEYLTTYAWAFILLIVALAAIQYFGILDFKKYLPQQCIFSSQFKCVDYTLSGGDIRLRLLNNVGVKLTVAEIIAENSEKKEIKCTSKYINDESVVNVEWKSGEEIDLRFSGCSGDPSYIPNERMEVIIRLRYYSPDTPVRTPIFHETVGKIKATVT